VETLQILNALHNPDNGWRHHPVVHMWAGYEQALCSYGLAICEEWVDARGYRDTVAGKIWKYVDLDAEVKMPLWLGDEDFHRSHRSNLLRKMPEHYRRYWPCERDDLPYVWPEKLAKRGDEET